MCKLCQIIIIIKKNMLAANRFLFNTRTSWAATIQQIGRHLFLLTIMNGRPGVEPKKKRAKGL
jgi:hypothetical protein